MDNQENNKKQTSTKINIQKEQIDGQQQTQNNTNQQQNQQHTLAQSNPTNNNANNNQSVNNGNTVDNDNQNGNGNDEQQWQSCGSQQQAEPSQSQLLSALQNALQQLQQNAQVESNQDHDEQQEDAQSLQIPLPPPVEEQTLGCQHYLRNCEVQAPCCKLYYTCKLCHDEKYEGPKSKGCKVERMAFDQVQHIKCLVCHTVQQPAIKCINPQCEVTFGKYTCLKCKLYENRSTKINDIFHCDECKMCRRGKADRFFHCKNCGYCRSISEKNNHKCTENAAESSCPICLQVLKYSTKHYYALPCGHLIHVECASSYTSINCPVCGMAMQKLSQNRNNQIEQMIEQTKANMPKELADKKVNILCNQCLHKSMNVQFHFFGMKCEKCGTFNTKMI